MPYIQCKRRKGWYKVDTSICLEIKCPHFRLTLSDEGDNTCIFKSKSQKMLEKRKK